MAILNDNHLLAGISGKIGNIVLKQVNGKTILSARPKPVNTAVTEKQARCRERFSAAVAYAKKINDDKEKKEAYRVKLQKGQNVYQYALKEYLDAGM